MTGLWVRLWLSRGFSLWLSIEAATLKLLRMFQMWFVFYLSILSSNLIFKCHKTKFQTCSSLNIWNHSNVDTFVQVSSLLTWDTLTHVSTVSTSENDYQANTVGKKIVLVASHRINHNDGSGTLVKWRAEGKYVGKGDYQNSQLSFYL